MPAELTYNIEPSDNKGKIQHIGYAARQHDSPSRRFTYLQIIFHKCCQHITDHEYAHDPQTLVDGGRFTSSKNNRNHGNGSHQQNHNNRSYHQSRLYHLYLSNVNLMEYMRFFFCNISAAQNNKLIFSISLLYIHIQALTSAVFTLCS